MSFSRCQLSLFVLLLLALLSGCGSVGEPLPPLIEIPNAVSDLQAVQFGESVNLSWTLPKLNTSGSAATTLSVVEIYRMTSSSAAPGVPEVKQFKDSAELWKTISKADFERYRKAEKLVVSDTLCGLTFQQVLRSQLHYAIRVLNKKDQDAGLSNLVSLRLYPVPRPPENLEPALEERSITISWEVPTRNNDGSALTSLPQFNVYRNVEPPAGDALRLNESPLGESRFRDQSIELGQTYCYSVRSLVHTPSGPVESANSKTITVTNSDTYPPKPPTEVTAISNGQFISVVWLPNAEPDLAGYWVYRAKTDRNYERLTEQLINAASTIDKRVEKGQTYFYRVKAVDIKGNESDLSEEVSDTVN